MEGEQPTIAAPELATPAIEAPVTTTEETTTPDEPDRILSPEEALSEQQTEEPEQVEDDSVEIEWDDGKKYKIPKAIEGGILKNKDYTTKTQEAAALRKQLESREVEINQKLEATEAELDARAEMRAVTKQLAEYDKLTPDDWLAHELEDAIKTRHHERIYQSLKARKAELEGTLTKAQSERSSAAQQALAKRVQDTVTEAPKIIPGCTPEVARKTVSDLVEFAKSEGIPDQLLEANFGPLLLKVLHRYQLGTNLLTKQATAPKLPTPQPKPLETVNGTKSAPTSGDLGSLDMEAYVAARKKGVGGKPLR
jgi:hypothetical protein